MLLYFVDCRARNKYTPSAIFKLNYRAFYGNYEHTPRQYNQRRQFFISARRSSLSLSHRCFYKIIKKKKTVFFLLILCFVVAVSILEFIENGLHVCVRG